MMNELETQLLELLQDQQKDLEVQLSILSGQLKIFQSMLSDSLEQLEFYSKNQESMLKRISVLEKKLKLSSLPAESQDSEGEGGESVSSEMEAREGMERVADRIREIIILDDEEHRAKEMMSLPSTSDFFITYESVMDIGWIDIKGKLSKKGLEEREKLLNNNKDFQVEVAGKIPEVKVIAHSDREVDKGPGC